MLHFLSKKGGRLGSFLFIPFSFLLVFFFFFFFKCKGKRIHGLPKKKKKKKFYIYLRSYSLETWPHSVSLKLFFWGALLSDCPWYGLQWDDREDPSPSAVLREREILVASWRVCIVVAIWKERNIRPFEEWKGTLMSRSLVRFYVSLWASVLDSFCRCPLGLILLDGSLNL